MLVHAAFEDAETTWARVEAELGVKGYKVVAVNLPGRDCDGTDPQKSATEDYKQAVLGAVSSEGAMKHESTMYRQFLVPYLAIWRMRQCLALSRMRATGTA